jgi:hypothetical protein
MKYLFQTGGIGGILMLKIMGSGQEIYGFCDGFST